MKRLSAILIVALLLQGLTGCNNITKPGVQFIDAELYKIPDYSQYIVLADYKNQEYEIDEEYEYTEDDIQQAITEELNAAFSAALEYEEIPDKIVEEGDFVTVSYNGLINGKPFDGSVSSEKGEHITVGMNEYGEDFEKKLIGMKPGETKETKVKLADGREADYTISVNCIYHYVLPEMTEEVVQKYTAYKNYDELMTDLDDYVRRSMEDAKKSAIFNNIMENIAKSSTYNAYPEEEMTQMVEDSVEILKEKSEEAGLSMNEVLEKQYGVEDEEGYRNMMWDKAKEFMELKMVVCTIAHNEGISVSENDINEIKDEIRYYYNLDSNADVSMYESEADMIYDCVIQKIKPIILDTAKEKTKS